MTFRTWKQIASALGVSTNTVKAWHRNAGMPVLVDEATGILRARADALLAWVRRQSP